MFSFLTFISDVFSNMYISIIYLFWGVVLPTCHGVGEAKL